MGARSVLTIAFAATLLACDDLPAAQDNVCGNKVVDPNEDCDTFGAGPSTLCRAPGTPGQCRYACGLQADLSTPVCPAGMGCGTDGTCRSPKGTFAPPATPVAGTFADLLVGDVDGDHRADVLGLEPSDFSTTFFDGTLTATATVHTLRSSAVSVHPLLRDVTGDGRADLLANALTGTLVNLGSASRAFVPTAYPGDIIPEVTDASVIVIKALPQNPGQTVFVMATLSGLSAIVFLTAAGQGGLFALLPKPAASVAGPVAVGHLVEDQALSPCDELALTFVGSDHVNIYTVCSPDGTGGYGYNQYSPTMLSPSEVALSRRGGLVAERGPILLDVNGDGHLDMLVTASPGCSGCDETRVAYGVGDGTFHSDPKAIPKSGGDGTFSTYPLLNGGLPLAMGDLNGDGVPDHVTESQVLVSKVNGSVVMFVPKAEGHGAPWTEAVIADFNHDGIPDVACGSSSSSNIDFFGGAGDGSFSPFVIQSAPVRHLTVGDYDGDQVYDLAVSEVAGVGDALGDSMSVLFGNAAGAPSPPVSMGRLVSINQIVSGKFVDNFGILSSTWGIVATSTSLPNTTSFAGFSGEGDRALRSPLGLNARTSVTTIVSGLPLHYAFGHFLSASGPIEAAAVDEQYFPVPPFPVHRLWVMPTDGLGVFTASAASGSEPLDGVRDGSVAFDWSHVAITAVDLDGSGLDDVVALGPLLGDEGHGGVAISHQAPSPLGGTLLTFGPITPTLALVDHTETDTVGSQTGRVLADDLDGDGNPDVVALATIAGAPTVVVFWNDHQGQLGAMTTVANPNGHAAVDFAVIDSKLAILTDEGVALVTFSQRAPSTPTHAFDVAQGHLIAAGDVDGDGVTDLVVASDAEFVVHRQEPVRQ